MVDQKVAQRKTAGKEDRSAGAGVPLLHFFFVVLGFELRAFALSHSTSPIFVKGVFEIGSENYLPGLASNCNPPDLCLPSS
jgi:hypothetical protein